MSTTDQKLLELLETKSFAELSADERALVIEHISEVEYELQREVLVASSDVLEDERVALTPDPRIKSNLRAAMGTSEGNSESGILRRILLKPIPAYQFAAAFAILAFLFAWKYDDTVEVVYKDKIVYQDRVDTVIIEKPMVEIQTVKRVVKEVQYVATDQPTPVKQRSAYQSERARLAEASANKSLYGFTDAQLEESKVKSFGNTSVDEETLTKFIAVLN